MPVKRVSDRGPDFWQRRHDHPSNCHPLSPENSQESGQVLDAARKILPLKVLDGRTVTSVTMFLRRADILHS